MTEADFRNAIRGVLRQHARTVEDAMRRELAEPFDLDPDERYQFEVCGFFYRIHLVQTEEEILAGSALLESIPAALSQAGGEDDVDLLAMLGEELFPWLAGRWQAVG